MDYSERDINTTMNIGELSVFHQMPGYVPSSRDRSFVSRQ
jgi:hypothetical protein